MLINESAICWNNCFGSLKAVVDLETYWVFNFNFGLILGKMFIVSGEECLWICIGRLGCMK